MNGRTVIVTFLICCFTFWQINNVNHLHELSSDQKVDLPLLNGEDSLSETCQICHAHFSPTEFTALFEAVHAQTAVTLFRELNGTHKGLVTSHKKSNKSPPSV